MYSNTIFSVDEKKSTFEWIEDKFGRFQVEVKDSDFQVLREILIMSLLLLFSGFHEVFFPIFLCELGAM